MCGSVGGGGRKVACRKPGPVLHVSTASRMSSSWSSPPDHQHDCSNINCMKAQLTQVTGTQQLTCCVVCEELAQHVHAKLPHIYPGHSLKSTKHGLVRAFMKNLEDFQGSPPWYEGNEEPRVAHLPSNPPSTVSVSPSSDRPLL